MRQKQMMYQWMVSGVRRLQAVVRRGDDVGVLAMLVLLLPLMAAGQDTPAALASPDSDEAVEALAATAPREGDLDTSFSGDGKVLTNLGGSNAALALAIQPNRKIVVAGSATSIGLVRYNPNGTLDSSFSGDGKVLTNLGGSEEANALAIQSNGKIVVAG
jgi:uncharacterized delta-60 repeat protein